MTSELVKKLLLPIPALVLCLASGCIEDAGTVGLVARAGHYELSVDQVVDLLADEENLAAQADVVEALANLWIDYTLLAEAAEQDSTFQGLDLEPLARNRVDQEMLFQLRDSVIQVDTFITQEELLSLYEQEAPALELRARHIMLTYPIDATAAQRDSVRGELQGLRDRIVGGASFEGIASQFSQDRGSAIAGGDLGFFGRGDMVQPFEEAALALEPGQMSEIVETPMGLHLIRLEERRTRDFNEVAVPFRRAVQARRYQEAESTFVAGLEARRSPELAEGAFDLTREVARNPGMRLSGRAARRALVSWDGGAVTVAELQRMLQSEAAPVREQLAASEDENLDAFLRGIARRELLVEEARVSGLEPPRARIDSLETQVADQLREAARRLGLTELERAPGEDVELAIARAVEQALMSNISGATEVVPLGIVAFQLRAMTPSTVLETGVGSAILEVGRVRANRRPSPVEDALDTLLSVPDTVTP